MLKMRKIQVLFMSFMLALSLNTLTAQVEVWPGDANNNGEVTNVDWLYLGYAKDAMGLARDSVFTGWAGQNATLWDQNFPADNPNDSINYAHADCDGDGFINFNDFGTIQLNYGETRGNAVPDQFGQAISGDPELTFGTPDTIDAGANVILTIPVELSGPSQTPIDFYGIAFSLEYDQSIIPLLVQDVVFTSESEWIDAGSPTVLLSEDNAVGTLDVAITRIDQNSVFGMGVIGTVSLIIEDNLFDNLAPDTNLNFILNKIQLIGEDFEDSPVFGDTLLMNLSTIGNTNTVQAGIIKIFPNPASDYVDVVSGNVEITQIECYNTVGQLLFTENISDFTGRIELPTFAKGTFMLRIVTVDGMAYIRRVVKH